VRGVLLVCDGEAQDRVQYDPRTEREGEKRLAGTGAELVNALGLAEVGELAVDVMSEDSEVAQ
jgi:hypothetical protein